MSSQQHHGCLQCSTMTAAAEETTLVVVDLVLQILLVLYFLSFLLLHPLQALLDVWPQILQQLHRHRKTMTLFVLRTCYPTVCCAVMRNKTLNYDRPAEEKSIPIKQASL